jgi:hypothetical protein
MLTEEAYRERKWGPFPFLRTVLEGKRVSSLGVTISTSDSFFESLSRLVEIATLACDNADELRGTAHSAGWDAMHRDIEVLRSQLQGASAMLDDFASRVKALHGLER